MPRIWGTHSICSACYAEREGDRVPVVLVDSEEETCCFCGKPTSEGIYYRAHRDDARQCADRENH